MFLCMCVSMNMCVMYVCVHECMHACMYVCVCKYIYIYIYVCMCVCMCVCIHTCAYIHIWKSYTHVSMYKHVNIIVAVLIRIQYKPSKILALLVFLVL